MAAVHLTITMPSPSGGSLPRPESLGRVVSGVLRVNSFDPNAPVPSSPVTNGCWADEVERQEKRRGDRRAAAAAAGAAPANPQAALANLSASLASLAVEIPPPGPPTPHTSNSSGGHPFRTLPSPAQANLYAANRPTTPVRITGYPAKTAPVGFPVPRTPEGPRYIPVPSPPSPGAYGLPALRLCPTPRHGCSLVDSPWTSGYNSAGSDEGSDMGSRDLFSSDSSIMCTSPSRPVNTASRSPPPSPSAEAALVEVVARMLRDPQVNPHQGSVSVDKLRFFVHQEAPQLYEAVVGSQDTFLFWKDFVGRHRDTLQLVRRNARLKRIYLTENRAWQENDKKMKAGIQIQEAQIVAFMASMLRTNPTLRLEEFVEAYTHVSQASPLARRTYAPLPQGADLQRLLQRHSYGLNSLHQIVALE